MSRPSFHHGNLREELLNLAAEELEAHGHEALSVRKLAGKLGVAPSASYRHFSSRDDLLLALATDATQELLRSYQAALALAAPAAIRLRTACEAYLRLARDRPALFRLVFASPLNWAPLPEEDSPALVAFTVFERLVEDNMAADVRSTAQAAAVLCWSLVHGFAMLRLSNRLFMLDDIEGLERAMLVHACDPRLAAEAGVEPSS